MKDTIIFKLTFEDIEMVLGRTLTEDEESLVYNKFSIDDWSDIVEIFLDVYNIRK